MLAKSVTNYGAIITDLKRTVNEKASSEIVHSLKMELTKFALYDDLTELHSKTVPLVQHI